MTSDVMRTPAPVVFRVEHEGETWVVRRHGFWHYEVAVERPLRVFVASYRWLWSAKRRCRKGGE